MAINNTVDISENDILDIGKDILKILLIDRTTKRNIIWASSDYEMLGDSYNAKFPITIDLITGVNSDVIQPRVTKNKDEQLSRTKERLKCLHLLGYAMFKIILLIMNGLEKRCF